MCFIHDITQISNIPVLCISVLHLAFADTSELFTATNLEAISGNINIHTKQISCRVQAMPFNYQD